MNQQPRSSVALPMIWEGATSLNLTDIERIQQGQWLTENIIDAFLLSIFPASKPYPSRRVPFSPIFLELLSKRGPLEVSEWITQSPQFQTRSDRDENSLYGVNLFKDFDVCAIPYNVQNMHWITLIINFKEKKLQVFDSIPRNSRYRCPFDGQLMRDFLVQEYERIYGDVDWQYFEDWNFDKPELFKPEGIVHFQKDGNNCGVWVIAFINNYLRELPMEGLSGKLMNSYRKTLAELGLEAIQNHTPISPTVIKREIRIRDTDKTMEEDFPPENQVTLIPRLSRTASIGRLPTLCRQKSISLAEAVEEEYKRAKAKRLIIEENQRKVKSKVLEIQQSITELLSMVEGLVPSEFDACQLVAALDPSASPVRMNKRARVVSSSVDVDLIFSSPLLE
jgi:hypothetical protein